MPKTVTVHFFRVRSKRLTRCYIFYKVYLATFGYTFKIDSSTRYARFLKPNNWAIVPSGKGRHALTFITATNNPNHVKPTASVIRSAKGLNLLRLGLAKLWKRGQVRTQTVQVKLPHSRTHAKRHHRKKSQPEKYGKTK